jgi:hypothetical protein
MRIDQSKPSGNGVAPVPRVALTRDETAGAMGVSVRLVDELIAGSPANGFPVCRINSRVVIPLDLLRDFLRDRATEVQAR